MAEGDEGEGTKELQIMKKKSSHNSCWKYFIQMLDHFIITGPNGSHQCLVYEPLAPNIPDIIDAHFPSGRLPGVACQDNCKAMFAKVE